MDNSFFNLIEKIKNMISPEQIIPTLLFLAVLLVIYVFFKILYKVFMKVSDTKLEPKLRLVFGKLIKYSGYVVIVLTIFSKLGINFSAVLGAVGIAGIAIGFAAQTSISNIISGFFLVSEKSIGIGDYISVDSDTAGTVKSVDLLSVKLVTKENKIVRVPNETLIKSNLINFSQNKIRRLSVSVSISYDESLPRVREVLLGIAEKHPLALENPAPVFIVDSFGDSAIQVTLGVWAEKEYFLDFQTSILISIHETFKKLGISIPYPQLDIHTAPVSAGGKEVLPREEKKGQEEGEQEVSAATKNGGTENQDSAPCPLMDMLVIDFDESKFDLKKTKADSSGTGFGFSKMFRTRHPDNGEKESR